MDETILKIRADIDKAIANFQKLGEKIKDIGEKAEKVAKTSGIAFGALSGVILGAAYNFGKQEEAVNSLNQSLKNQGIFTDELSKSYQDLASALQQKTRFGDEDIIQSQSVLQNYLGEEKITKDLMEAVLDLATAKKMDLASAADLVGKSIGTSTNALQRSGVEVDATASKTEKLGQVIAGISEKFGGQATAATQGFNGAMAQLKNSTGDVLETLGEQFAPILTTLAQKLRGLVDAMNANKEAFKIGAIIIGVTAAMTGLVAAASSLVAIFATLATTTIPTLITAFKALGVAMKAHPIIAIISGIALAIGTLWVAWQDNWGNMQQYVGGVVKAIKAILTELKDIVIEVGVGISDVFGGILNRNPEQIISGIKQLKDAFDWGDFSGKIKAAFEDGYREADIIIKKSNKKTTDSAEETAKKTTAYHKKAVEEKEKEDKKYIENKAKIEEDAEAKRREKEQARAGGINQVLGFGTSMLQGEAGAVKVVSELGGKLADTLVPGIGEAVSPLLTELAKGPENAKKMIREFIDALPDVIVNIVEALAASADIIVEKFIDVFLIEGGLERVISALVRGAPKIAYALANSTVEALGNTIQAVSRRFGIDAGKNISESLSAKTLMPKIEEGFEKILEGFEIIPMRIGEGFQKAISGLDSFMLEIMPELVALSFQSVRDFFIIDLPEYIKLAFNFIIKFYTEDLPGYIFSGFKSVFDFFTASPSAIELSFTSAMDKITDRFLKMGEDLVRPFDNLWSIFEYFNDSVNYLWKPFEFFADWVHKLTTFGGLTEGGGGGFLGQAGDFLSDINPFAVGGIPKFASNGLVMPRGSDYIPAMLSEDEHVINPRSARANRSLLKRINSAGAGIQQNQSVELKLRGEDDFGKLVEKVLIRSNALKTLSFSLDYGRG